MGTFRTYGTRGIKDVLRTKGINLAGLTRLTVFGLLTFGARTARIGRGAKLAFGAKGAGLTYFFGIPEKKEGIFFTLLTLGTLGTGGTASSDFVIPDK